MLQLILTLAAVAQPQLPPQVPFPPQSVRPPELVQSVPEPARSAPKPTAYTAAVEAAFTAQKPLVVFVGTPSRRIPGIATVHTETLDGYTTGTVVVAVPGRSWMIVRTSLPADATDARIVASIREEVARTAIPFRLRGLRFGEIALPDDSETAMGPWPKSLVIFQGMRRYRSARFTQAIYTLNGRPQIDMVPRSSLKEEWQVPGGMEGIVGWRSDLYKYVPDGYWQQWQRRLPVVNSFGYTQYELGYTRSYPDGTFFVDALSNADGKPFEVRVREKQEGKWTSYIAWKDVSERPVGYHGLTKKCSDCHSQAGTGNYGAAMVSGADTVFSDPFDFSRTSIAGD